MNRYSIRPLEETGLVTTLLTGIGLGRWLSNDPQGHENYRAVAAELGIPAERTVGTFQRHTSHVEAVDGSEGGKYTLWRPDEITPRDGIVTDEPGLLLTSIESDCTPVFLLDPVKKAIGMVHSGWKGTAAQITVNAIRLMGERYGSAPRDVLAAFGPCICRDCYEVGGELIDSFRENYTPEELEQVFLPRSEGKYSLDLKRAIRFSLEKEGLQPDHIYDFNSCTMHEGRFYSHRARAKAGLPTDLNMLTGIMLKSE